jgi:uridylate kinase
VLLKLSGQALCAEGGFGVEAEALSATVEEMLPVVEMGVQVAAVIGGGNFIRGRELTGDPNIQRVTADYMGMLATVMNGLALQDSLEARGIQTRVLGAITMAAVCEPFIRRRAVRHLEKGRVIILAGGTGSPFFTTDTCAALRAREIGAEILLKATKVDGVFDSDPQQNPDAKKYDRLTYEKALSDRLAVMDATAISMCMESKMPILVFRLSDKGNLAAAVRGEKIGTIVTD